MARSAARRSPPQPRLQQAVVTRVLDPQRRLDVRVQAFEDERVEVVAAELVVAGGGQDLDDALFDAHHRDVEGPAAQVVDEEGAASRAAALVAERGGRRFVDDPHDRQAGDLPGFACRLPLRVGEVGRDGDDRLAHFAAERAVRPLFERLENEGRNLLRAVGAVPHPHLRPGAHQALDREHRPLGGGRGLVAGPAADDDGAGVVESHARGQDGFAALLHDRGPPPGDDRHLGVRGAQIDADDGVVVRSPGFRRHQPSS